MKEKLKVYHGLPKTPITDDTVFYADSSIFSGNVTYLPSITGYSVKSDNILPLDKPSKVSTVEFWINGNVIEGTDTRFFLLRSGDNYVNFRTGSDNTLHVDVYIKETNTVHFSWVRLEEIKQNSTYNHVRVVFDTEKLNITYYFNGVPYSVRTDRTPFEVMHQVLDNVVDVKFDVSRGFSDFHLSSAVNYDYFPTLPQDFIDGKAIVVPSLNQRQSYGDPVLHQVTELLVRNQPLDVLGTIYDLNDKDSDNLERCFTNPELRTAYADGWEQGQAKIRITGLEKSIITGVFDTDTAKCRIVSEVRNTKIVPVSSVSGISVGDTLVYVYSSDFRAFNLTYTVQAVDSVNNTITLDSNSNWYAGDYFFETTASSSCPVVKTVDGTVVNGTWSGLGTNVATFTLGSNSNIAGKDLVVTYCLNAVGNSSPYPKMPSEVIRGYNELDDTMLPTDNIILTDNFTGKITGDFSSCPHSLKYFCASSTLKSPKDTDWVEFTQHQYNALSNNQEVSIATDTNNMIPQILVEWDLVELIERKFGGTIPGNKINWINGNVSKVQCYAICRGENGETYKSTLSYYNSSSSWSTNSSGATITSPEFNQLKCLVSNANGRTYKTTNFYCLLYPDAVKNSNTARIILQDIYFEIVFETDTRFDYLFPENPLSKCNPILVGKQTKEVKRLLPSNAPFSTEVLLYNSEQITDLNATLLLQSTNHFLTTSGTGSSVDTNNVYRGLIGKLDLKGINSSVYLNDIVFSSPVNNHSSSGCVQGKFVLSQPHQANMNFYQPNEIIPNVRQLLLKPQISHVNKELYMRLFAYDIGVDSQEIQYSIQYYKLPNRPLIK